MTPEIVIDIGRRAIEIGLMLAAPMLVASLVVGLIVSIFQAVTQINEVTITFIPKIIAVFLALIFFLPWMLQLIIGYTSGLYMNIPNYIR